ncbi:hypothetical protein F4779DRAFT_635684 [Xylariaceae sp. FL0662B]|nr:hypothetical protein F4779DRAFT_635684 [Xylariaceae sp. FL0662B]
MLPRTLPILLLTTHPLLGTSQRPPSPSPSSPSGLLNGPPPPFLQTPDPSLECAGINGGSLQCCDGSLAGDVEPVVLLAGLLGYPLNPDDVNGVLCHNSGNADACPGVKLCCQVTALNPLLSLYCQDY